MQTITPYLLYEDVDAALEWLTKAFGFVEFGERFSRGKGKTNHAAMKVGDEIIMMGCPLGKYKNPKRLGQVTQHIYINIENVDEHFARAVKAGANVLQPPEDQFYGHRRYGVADPEGHQWYFAQEIKKPSRKAKKK
jgi:PhnB protein